MQNLQCCGYGSAFAHGCKLHVEIHVSKLIKQDASGQSIVTSLNHTYRLKQS